MPSSQSIIPLVRKMERRDRLSDAEREALAGLLAPERTLTSGAMLIEPGDRPRFSTLLISGFCARFNLTSSGGRQLTEINVGGDFVDLHSLLMAQMDHGVVALGECTVSSVAHADLRRLTERHPHLGRLLWLETVIDGAIHRQWLVTMGQQDAASRLAHLVCELYRRLEAAGLASGARFRIPMTQADLGDVLGLTPIHVNRVLMELRREALVEWKGNQVAIPDWDRLAAFAQFDPTYLRLERAPV